MLTLDQIGDVMIYEYMGGDYQLIEAGYIVKRSNPLKIKFDNLSPQPYKIFVFGLDCELGFITTENSEPYTISPGHYNVTTSRYDYVTNSWPGLNFLYANPPTDYRRVSEGGGIPDWYYDEYFIDEALNPNYDWCHYYRVIQHYLADYPTITLPGRTYINVVGMQICDTPYFSETGATISYGTKAFIVPGEKTWLAGEHIQITSSGNPQIGMQAAITSIIGDTVYVDVFAVSGEGEYSQWNIARLSYKVWFNSRNFGITHFTEQICTIAQGYSVSVKFDGSLSWMANATVDPSEVDYNMPTGINYGSVSGDYPATSFRDNRILDIYEGGGYLLQFLPDANDIAESRQPQKPSTASRNVPETHIIDGIECTYCVSVYGTGYTDLRPYMHPLPAVAVGTLELQFTKIKNAFPITPPP